MVSVNRIDASRRIALVGGLRTPLCKAGTELKNLGAVQLGGFVFREVIERSDLDPSEIDEVLLGCVGQPHNAQNVGRAAALWAGVPNNVPAVTVHRNCASGFDSITSAAEKILTGQGDLYLAGGAESMSNYPLILQESFSDLFVDYFNAKTWLAKLAVIPRIRPHMLMPDAAVKLGLTDYSSGLIMGKTGENLAVEFGVSREEQDRFALESHKKAAANRDRREEEVLSIPVPPYKKMVSHDNGVREEQTMEALGKLKPYFDRAAGTVTVGNSCPITDGAAAMLVTTEEKARALGFRPDAFLRAYNYAGLAPERMGLGPVFATSRVLDRENLSLSDIDVIELNEAFAAQVIACERAFASKKFAEKELGKSEAVGELDPAKLNVNGGAIALGHPVGATGTRLVLTVIREMRRRDASLGLATACVGGGQGGALVIERK